MDREDLKRANGLMAEIDAMKKAADAWSCATSWHSICIVLNRLQSPAYPDQDSIRYKPPSDESLHVVKSVVIAEFNNRILEFERELSNL